MNEKQLEKLLYQLGDDETRKPSPKLVEKTKYRIAPNWGWSMTLLTLSILMIILGVILTHLYIFLAPIGYVTKLMIMGSTWSFTTLLGAGIIFNGESVKTKLAFLYEVIEY